MKDFAVSDSYYGLFPTITLMLIDIMSVPVGRIRNGDAGKTLSWDFNFHI